jgi:hypothetical protein
MRKIISILAFLMVAIVATAQIPMSGGLAIGAANSIAVASLAATGRIVAATNYVFEAKAPAPFFYEWSVRLMQKHASNNTATIAFYGALENSANAYKQIGSTITWAGTTTDTCAVVSSSGSTVANSLNWRFIKCVVTPSDTAWVEHVLFNYLPSVTPPLSITPGR